MIVKWALRHSPPKASARRVLLPFEKKCPACCKVLEFPAAFIGVSGGVISRCTSCSQKSKAYREKYKSA